MSDEKDDDLLSGILGDELGEWDKMFDSLHETSEENPGDASAPAAEALEAAEGPNALFPERDPATPVAILKEASAPVMPHRDPVDPLGSSILDFELSDMLDPVEAEPARDPLASPFDDDGGVTLGPPGAVLAETLPGADDDLSFGGVPQSLGTLLGSEGHDDLELELEISEAPRAQAPGLGDVALADVLASAEVASPEDELARITDSANAFFDDGPNQEVSLSLDEDFYEGIEVGDGAIPTPIPEDEPIESASFALPEALSDAPTPVRGVTITPDAVGVAAAESIPPDESDGIPTAIPEVGHGALRTGAIRAESEDSLELQSEVEGALDEIREGPRTPAPGDVKGEEDFEIVAEEPAVDDGVIRDPVPRLDGVVEAAVEDAVAMSTGTLHTGPQLLEADVEPDLPPSKFSGAMPELDLARIHVADRVDPDVSDRTEEVANLLVLYERELGLLDEPGAIIRMRIESGRLAESLGDLDRARRHLDEALKLDPRLVPANRALRRIERRLGNWDQVVGQLDNEILKAGAMESRALAAYRVDLLMSVGELDLARVAVGELLDSAPKDTRALLANLELSFVDGRDDEVQGALAGLAESLTGPRLRSAVCALAGTIAANDSEQVPAASTYFEAAEAASPNLGAQIAHAALLQSKPVGERFSALVRGVGEKNSEVGAALAWRRVEKLIADGEAEQAQGLLGEVAEALPGNPLLVDCALRVTTDPAAAADAWESMARVALSGEVAAQALCRAAQFALQEPADLPRARSLAEQALSLNAGDACGQVLLRTLDGASIAALSADAPSSSLREAFVTARGFQEAGDVPSASAVVDGLLAGAAPEAHALRTFAVELALASDDQAAMRRHLAALATDAGSHELATSAARAGARAQSRLATTGEEHQVGLLLEAAEAWRVHAAAEPGIGAEAALLFARLSGDEASIAECSAVASEQTASRDRRGQLAVIAAGQSMQNDPGQAAEALNAVLQEGPDARSLELFWAASLVSDGAAEAAEALETEVARGAASADTLDRYRFRSAYVRVQNDLDVDTAIVSLSSLQANRAEFGAAGDLLSTARSHSGGGGPSVLPKSEGDESSGVAQTNLPQDSISTEIRQIEALERAGQQSEAADRSSALRERHPGDAVVEHTFKRQSWKAGASADLAEHALAELRLAEERSDMAAKAEACEELARIDLDLRGDRDSAQMFWESASKAAPERADLQRILEGAYRGSAGHQEEQRSLMGRVIASLDAGSERSAYLVARARLSMVLEREASVVRSDYEGALEDDALCREALFYLESEASLAGPTETLANLEAKVSQYFSENPRARGAFLVRSGETWRSLGQRDQCLARLKAALQVVPGFAPALSAWRDLALDHELWAELAEACTLEAESVGSDGARESLFLLAGVTLMDKVDDAEGATTALRKVLVVDPLNREAFVRLRQLFTKSGNDEDLAQLLSMRLEAGPDDELERCELHLALARVLRAQLSDSTETLVHYRALLALRPNDQEAVEAIADIAWESEQWADAAEALMIQARIEQDEAILVVVFTRLGTIYADHLPEPRWALKSFHKVVTLDPGNQEALRRIASLGAECGEHRLALGACEQLIKQEPPVAERIEVLILMASILRDNAGDAKNAERALRHALDLDPSSDIALDALVRFYVEQKDLRSARVHVDRVANAMRKRIQESNSDAEAYRVLARAMAAKANAGASECMPTAQVAASLAVQLGVTDAENSALAKQVGPGMGTGLAGDEFDDLLFTHSASGSARTIFSLLGARLAKHIGIDIRSHGVGRSDRLRKGIDDAAGVILELAVEMGVEDVDIYVSKQKTNLVAVEPTSPVSLILGENVAKAERLGELRYFVGRSLKGASSSLSAPLQLGVEKFGILLVGILRQFQPEFSPLGVDTTAASTEQQRLRRLIPSNLLQELQPYALGLATSDFDHKAIWLAMADACNRAGLLCAGDGSAAITGLMRTKGFTDVRKALQDPEIASLIKFACSDQHGKLWAAMRA